VLERLYATDDTLVMALVMRDILLFRIIFDVAYILVWRVDLFSRSSFSVLCFINVAWLGFIYCEIYEKYLDTFFVQLNSRSVSTLNLIQIYSFHESDRDRFGCTYPAISIASICEKYE